MSVFFRVLTEGLAGKRLRAGEPTGTIVFRVFGLEEERWLVRLGQDGCFLTHGDLEAPDLAVYCDQGQLLEMLTNHFSGRPLRIVGDVRLLDTLARVVSEGGTPLALRLKKQQSR